MSKQVKTMRARLLVVTVAIFAACTLGSIQYKKFVGSLFSLEGEYLAEVDGRLVLKPRPKEAMPKSELSLSEGWRISAPYLEAANGRFLSIDQTDQGVQISLGDKKESSKWAIDVIKSTKPEAAGKLSGGGTPTKGSMMLKGESTIDFRLIVFEGRYKGWYLSTTRQPAADQNAIAQEFRVVQSPKEATIFHYTDTCYHIGGK